MPSLADVNISEITELWHFTFTIDLRNEKEHVFQYFGPQLASIFGNDYSGESVEQAFQDSKLSNMIGFYPHVVEKREPAMEAASFYLESQEVRYRSLIVPLSSDGKHVDFLLGTTNYKVFTTP